MKPNLSRFSLAPFVAHVCCCRCRQTGSRLSALQMGAASTWGLSAVKGSMLNKCRIPERHVFETHLNWSIKKSIVLIELRGMVSNHL